MYVLSMHLYVGEEKFSEFFCYHIFENIAALR